MVNIGEEGKVDFTSAGRTVTVAPGSYSVALPGQPPSQPTAYQAVADQTAKSGDGSTSNKESANKTDGSQQSPYGALKETDEDGDDNSKSNKNRRSIDRYKDHMKWISKAMADTKLKDRPRFEKPMDVLRALRHDAGASSRMAAKLRPDPQVGRVRNDRRPNGVMDGVNGSGNGDGQDNESNKGNANNAAGSGNDNGRGKSDGGSDGSKGSVTKVGDVSVDRGNGDAPKGDKAQGGGEGSSANTGNGNNSGSGNAIGDSPKDRGRGGEGNGDGPKDRNRGGDGSKTASSDSSGNGAGRTMLILPALTPAFSSGASTPSASPVATSSVVSTPVLSPVVPSPMVSAPVTSPVLGGPVAPTAPVVPVSPPAVITGAAKLNKGHGGGNSSGKNK